VLPDWTRTEYVTFHLIVQSGYYLLTVKFVQARSIGRKQKVDPVS
jgi:hypothetical protein